MWIEKLLVQKTNRSEQWVGGWVADGVMLHAVREASAADVEWHQTSLLQPSDEQERIFWWRGGVLLFLYSISLSRCAISTLCLAAATAAFFSLGGRVAKLLELENVWVRKGKKKIIIREKKMYFPSANCQSLLVTAQLWRLLALGSHLDRLLLQQPAAPLFPQCRTHTHNSRSHTLWQF